MWRSGAPNTFPLVASCMQIITDNIVEFRALNVGSVRALLNITQSFLSLLSHCGYYYFLRTMLTCSCFLCCTHSTLYKVTKHHGWPIRMRALCAAPLPYTSTASVLYVSAAQPLPSFATHTCKGITCHWSPSRPLLDIPDSCNTHIAVQFRRLAPTAHCHFVHTSIHSILSDYPCGGSSVPYSLTAPLGSWRQQIQAGETGFIPHFGSAASSQCV